MTTPVGGQRARYLLDSYKLHVSGILDDLGWLDTAPGRTDVTILAKAPKWNEPVDPNSFAISPGHIPNAEEAEVGSQLGIRTWTFYNEFYAENEPIGMHFINDLRDALTGLMPSIGCTSPFFTIYALGQATPPEIGRAEITSCVSTPPPPTGDRPWAEDLHTLVVEAQDTYGNEDD